MAWSNETKAEARRLYETDGLAAAHTETGVPKATIGTWARKEGWTQGDAGEAARRGTEVARVARHEKMAERRHDVRCDLADTAQLLLSRIRKEEAASKCQAYAIAAAVLIDKWQVIGWGDGVVTEEGLGDPRGAIAAGRERARHLMPVPDAV